MLRRQTQLTGKIVAKRQNPYADSEIPKSPSRGVETFFDGVKFDPDDPTAYLKSLKIVMRLDHNGSGEGPAVVFACTAHPQSYPNPLYP